MPIRKVELLEDKVRITYDLQTALGYENIKGAVRDVPYDSILNLPPVPEFLRQYECPIEFKKIEVLAVGRVIVIAFTKHLERSYGPMEESFYGPFLENTDQPSISRL